MVPNEGEPVMGNETGKVEPSLLNPGNSSESPKGASSDNEGLCILPSDKGGLHRATTKVHPQTWTEKAISPTDLSTSETRNRDVLFKNLSVSGTGSAVQIQQTVLSAALSPLVYPVKRFVSICGERKQRDRRTILHGFDGIVRSGELLLVLGRPGSGCSTLLKVLCGYLDGLILDPGSEIQYKGIPFATMIKHYRGEIVYSAEADHHFPNLTVGQTLEFAAHARAPRNRLGSISRNQYVESAVRGVMDTFSLSHTYNTNVGNSYIPGVSGGERKRVSIAEMVLSRASVGAWDNSTCGLDAATAVDFVRALRTSAKLAGSCHAVAAYQAPEALYDTFDKVILLYEGRQIYFGSREGAVMYFEKMGWKRPLQQSSADYLTAVTNPGERECRPDMEHTVPRTPQEFETHWKQSPEYAKLQISMTEYKENNPLDGSAEAQLKQTKRLEQATYVRPSSAFLLSMPMQIRLCMARAWQRTRNDIPALVATAVAQMVVSLIIGSLFCNIPNNTEGLNQRASVLFLAVLTNALISLLEINTLYSQRPIVEKQAAYAFVHPSTEAIAAVVVDFPVKFLRCVLSAIVVYFFANLRREPAQFFIYILFQLTAVMTMATMFRTLATVTKTIGQAMALAGITIICVAVYTGFTVPQFNMRPWFGWIRWANPIFYAFEGIVANEFHGRRFQCMEYIPASAFHQGLAFTCAYVGSVPGERFVSGDAYIAGSYDYSYNHIWRNYGILLGFLIFFHILYFSLTELIPGTIPAHEVLTFRSGRVPEITKGCDLETGTQQPLSLELKSRTTEDRPLVGGKKDTLLWKGLSYDIPIKGGEQRLLDDVSGWVKPGSLTALMGVSGAGKTTLMNVLAQRMSIGVVTGDMLVNGHEPDASFARETGYVQQQDLHVETCTVREALRFSATLRQPRSVSMEEKYTSVEDVIQLLGMDEFAEAVVGNPGDGLNMEQRKLLSIGVELAAKPQILIFLDEPTSGLDSRSSWAICTFMRKLADHGQPVLATIHQPSAILFEQFDRLLFLAKGGKTVYFGDLGNQARILLEYLEANGARPCGPTENPAEYMLDVIGNGTEGQAPIDWVGAWRKSPQYQKVLEEIELLIALSSDITLSEPTQIDEFAMPFVTQFCEVMKRDFQQYYRQPEYILAKFGAGVFCGLFIGFSFWKSDNSSQGFQNVLFSLFLLCTIFSTLVNQIMPKFIARRELYELRERPAKTYSWKVFILCQILVELPWQALLGVCAWASFYFSVFGNNQSPQRQVLVLLFTVQFFVFASTFAQLVVAAVPNLALGSMLATFTFLLCLLFNGIMQPPSALPHFWTFMHRVSPLTYYVSGISSTALHGRPIHCSNRELRILNPPEGQTCGQYLLEYLREAPGSLYNPLSTEKCQYCPLRSADQYLAAREISWDDRWRNFGIFWAYIIFNMIGAIGLYYLFRVLPYARKNGARKSRT